MNNVLDLIKQSFIIMILGMFIVFIFIEIMIFFINLTHIVINRKNKSFDSTEGSKERSIYARQQDEINKKALNKNKETKTGFENEGEKNIYDKAAFDENVVSAIFTVVKLHENNK